MLERVPACCKIAGVELVCRLERFAGPLCCFPPERSEQHPFPGEPNEPKPVVGEVGLPVRVEVEVDGDLFHELWVGWCSGGLLDPVGDKR